YRRIGGAALRGHQQGIEDHGDQQKNHANQSEAAGELGQSRVGAHQDRSPSTFSGGRPSTARAPRTTTGRSIRRGFEHMAAISASSLSAGLSSPNWAYSVSPLRSSARASIPSFCSSALSCTGVGGCSRYNTISGVIPLCSINWRVCRDLLQRGL